MVYFFVKNEVKSKIMWQYNNTNELYHFGIKGMKWGVRRYQNYDGSYTQAGVKRYQNAMNIYEKRKSDYDISKKQGLRGDALKLKKAKVKEAKREVKKHYKHLALDKKADKGKIRYARGQRISNNDRIARGLIGLSSVAASAALYNNYTSALGSQKVTEALINIGKLSLAAAAIKRLASYGPNEELRAYYNHTSNY